MWFRGDPKRWTVFSLQRAYPQNGYPSSLRPQNLRRCAPQCSRLFLLIMLSLSLLDPKFGPLQLASAADTNSAVQPRSKHDGGARGVRRNRASTARRPREQPKQSSPVPCFSAPASTTLIRPHVWPKLDRAISRRTPHSPVPGTGKNNGVCACRHLYRRHRRRPSAPEKPHPHPASGSS